jgi:hypothetical protein
MRNLKTDGINLVLHGNVQTFIDNVIIESVQDVTRLWHTPVRKQEDPIIKADKPWEQALWLAYFRATTVLRDPEDGLFKCWYQNQRGKPSEGWSPGRNHPNFNLRATHLYAESKDGIHWVKPELDVLEVDGQKTNTVLGGGDFGDVHAMTVALDPYPPTPQERFRALFVHMWPDSSGLDVGNSRLECAHSADGIHWQIYPELPVGAHLPSLFYDEAARQFVANGRFAAMASAPATNPHTPLSGSFLKQRFPHSSLADNTRRIWQYRSGDCIHWGDPVLVAAIDDEEDNLDDQFYGMAQYKLGNQHLALITVLHGVCDEKDVQLLASRDGIRWSRLNRRQPFLATRGDGYWDAHMVSIPCPPIDVGDEHWFFYGGQNYRHDWWLCGLNEGLNHPEARNPEKFSAGLGLATLRKHGYAGLYGGEVREGVVVTRPLLGEGEVLVINAKCGAAGSIRAEIVDRCDNVIGNCSRDDCDPFTGDEIAHAMTWEGMQRIEGNHRKVRFYLRDTELFSFGFKREGEEQQEVLW